MITIATLTAVFGVGLIAGLVALVQVGIAREEHDRSLLDEPSTLTAALTRRIVGLYVRTPRRIAVVDESASPAEAGRH